jgi:hypothetical protein
MHADECGVDEPSTLLNYRRVRDDQCVCVVCVSRGCSAQITCFTSTKVQILTQQRRSATCQQHPLSKLSKHAIREFMHMRVCGLMCINKRAWFYNFFYGFDLLLHASVCRAVCACACVYVQGHTDLFFFHLFLF